MKCKYCGKQISREKKFCSPKCYWKWQKDRPYEERYGLSKAKEIKNKISKAHFGKGFFSQIQIVCKVCGKTISVSPSDFKGGRKFCSRNCYETYRKGKTFEELYGKEKGREIAEKISKAHKGRKKSKDHIQKILKTRKKRGSWEKKVAINIKDNYDFFIFPQAVCDRIAVKENTIFFIEIKQPKKHDKLRSLQKQFKKIVERINSNHIKYLVVRCLGGKDN